MKNLFNSLTVDVHLTNQMDSTSDAVPLSLPDINKSFAEVGNLTGSDESHGIIIGHEQHGMEPSSSIISSFDSNIASIDGKGLLLYNI